MNYYKYKNKYLISFDNYNFEKISYEDLKKNQGRLYFLRRLDPLYSRRSFLISDSSLLLNKKEDLKLLKLGEDFYRDSYLEALIKEKRLISINTNYPKWEEVLFKKKPDKYRVNLLALGDVGSNLAIGLRLLGGDSISSLNIYDRNENNLNRWFHELNQINVPFKENSLPIVRKLDSKELFDCDIFIFCASKGIPTLDSDIKDVRMAQFEANSKIVKEYALMAREKGFEGIFALVSDPVDLLCKVAFLESNKSPSGDLDFQGMAAEQIIGYGLGVMNGRASFYADQMGWGEDYINEARVFGPHGEGLVCANSIENYDEELSDQLTESVLNANLVVRSFGYKPYIAPSLSSGSISLVHTMTSKWFYGSTYMGGAYIGSKCRLINNTIELERLDLPDSLYERLVATNKKLVDLL